ncbi:DUF6355 family natural product biosynthesis protein [Amycolatopsis sp. NPDC059657]|uniref:DUF6355 family natural product biosynthesis protein n=1 Tax=Amycolatopsis sp. NPDC059657 TaxID=3346899 RepID=UPI00366D74F2
MRNNQSFLENKTRWVSRERRRDAVSVILCSIPLILAVVATPTEAEATETPAFIDATAAGHACGYNDDGMYRHCGSLDNVGLDTKTWPASSFRVCVGPGLTYLPPILPWYVKVTGASFNGRVGCTPGLY